jgi:hypothetical protein
VLVADLNSHNDAYPLTRTGHAAAIASLQHEAKISDRLAIVKGCVRELAVQLNGMGRRRFLQKPIFSWPISLPIMRTTLQCG